MNKTTIQLSALIIAMSAATGLASAQSMSSPSPVPSDLARHGPPIDAAGANGGASSHPQSGTNIPSTTGATKPKKPMAKTSPAPGTGTEARHGDPMNAAGTNSGSTSHPNTGTDQPSTSGMPANPSTGR